MVSTDPIVNELRPDLPFWRYLELYAIHFIVPGLLQQSRQFLDKLVERMLLREITPISVSLVLRIFHPIVQRRHARLVGGDIALQNRSFIVHNTTRHLGGRGRIDLSTKDSPVPRRRGGILEDRSLGLATGTQPMLSKLSLAGTKPIGQQPPSSFLSAIPRSHRARKPTRTSTLATFSNDKGSNNTQAYVDR
ncbi:hypothetical protein KC335_g156 [Hortaea werneckii]|nr:hypothetical protein KC335_g156 [Hortaea werneckii]